MRHFLAEIERPGRQHEIDPSEFFARAEALGTLISAYESSGSAWDRWKLLRLARKTRSSEARAFLMREAIKPVPRPAADAVGVAETTGNEEYVNRLEASLGVLDHLPDSESDLADILTSADKSVTRPLALELLVRGGPSEALMAVIRAEALPTGFRSLPESEERALMSDRPSNWKVQP
jgi:hypothetical protein